MTDPDRHLMTIFSAALSYSGAGDRDAYLDQACAGDAGPLTRDPEELDVHA